MTKIRSRDASRIQDRRGQSSGGAGGLPGGLGDLLRGGLGGGGGGNARGGGLPIPGGLGGMGTLLKGGGGLVMLLLMGAVFILPKVLGGGLGATASGPATGANVSGAAEGAGAATSGGDEQACSSELEQVLCGATNDVSDYWIDQLPLSFGVGYVESGTVFFSGYTDTGCGQASSQTGPFYCPLDSLVYFDLDFLVALQNQFGATGDLAAQYIVAHEYGHHVQNVLGVRR